MRKRAAKQEPVRREPRWDDDIVLEPEYAGSGSIGRGREPEQDTEDRSWSSGIEYEGDDSVQVYRGMQVRHPKFGVGSVVSWTGSGENMKLTASFSVGRKTIMARFCELL